MATAEVGGVIDEACCVRAWVCFVPQYSMSDVSFARSNQYISVCTAGSFFSMCDTPANLDNYTGSFAIILVSVTNCTCVHHSGMATMLL